MRILLLILSLFIVSGCVNNKTEEKAINVAAAADLSHAFTEIGKEFTEETGIKVEFTFGSTGLLTKQIKEGAPFDLFAAAHESYIDDLLDSESVLEDSKEYYAIGRIVLMANKKEDVILDKNYLLSPEVKTITIANPEHAPYGKAAKETLEAWGIWEEIEPKIVYAENIRQAYQYVESGNADAGLIALALMTETEYPYEVIDEDNHQPIVQALAIPSQTDKEEWSRQFSDFILSDKGKETLKKYGFDLP
ncbi:molybdate ABC transporter substrate-binding protein [Robertmurraya korlensis]|uniref:molybdate ABC transporter substrate-binding protein n=1 Tax=Robertmurraya korlensis TaxID=519977 RepID=UPI00204141D7|nr:molybdate ABC transporter substrate-binding protein [Robertmurraya korlensis]MCM3601018.1 molybdate ABC transporter substrate-binding protein [Robertmurraya korlensis]